jgi:hypothetical protein
MPPEKIHMQVLNFQRRNVGGNIVFLRAVGTLDFGYGYSSWWIKSTRNPNSGNAATLRVMSPQGTEATIGPLQTVTDFEDENVIGWWALVPTSANSSAWNRSEIPLVFTLTDRKP